VAVNKAVSASGGVRARRQLETRRRITESAAAVFREHGYEAATMRAIAARAKVATGTLFLYAPEKRSLLLMILNKDLDRAGELALRTLDAGAPLLEQLVHIFRTRYTFLGRDTRLSLDALQQSSFLLNEDKLKPDSEAGRYLARLNAMRDGIAELITGHQRRGAVRPDVDPDDAASVAMAIYSSEVRMWLRLRNPRVASGIRILERRLALALRGMLIEPA
jgi:AcrR family transcriptional regulator